MTSARISLNAHRSTLTSTSSFSTKRTWASILGTITFGALTAPICLPSTSHAYFSTLDTGEVGPTDRYQVMAEPQVILSRFDGFNFSGHLERGINESSSARAVIGFGKVDFQAGAFYKWVPFPDTPDQPALGIAAGLLLGRITGETELSLRLHPIVSKKFETELGDLIPYASIPFGVTARKEGSVIPVQLVAGSELRPLNAKDVSYFIEVGTNIDKAFSYISVAFTYRFDKSVLQPKSN